MLSSMCQHVARLQFVSRAEKDSLCGTVMMGWIWDVWINAMVFVPMAQAPPKAGAKDLSYNSLNLIHEFTSLFSRKVIVAGLPRKAFPRKQAFVDINVFLCLRKQQPRFAQGQPKGYFLTKELDRTTEAFARTNVVWEGPVCWVQCANMWQDCSLTAVQRKTAFLEQSWWPEFEMFGSMPWCSFQWHKLLPRLAKKNCHRVIQQSEFDPWVYILFA